MMRIWLPYPRQKARGAFLTLFALALLAGLGCGKGKRGTVSGIVTGPDGKPITVGTVSFVDAKNRTGTGNIDNQGHYTVTDAPVGEVTVIVNVPKRPMMMGGAQMPKPPKDMKQMKPPEGMEPPGGTQTNVDPRKIPSIPPKYTTVKDSPLKLKVEEGTQEFPIKLVP
jgi:hypothetical protein